MKEETKKESYVFKRHHHGGGSSSSAVYGLGFVGAFIYFIQNSHTFMEGLVGFLKALTWPAFLIYKIFTLLKM